MTDPDNSVDAISTTMSIVDALAETGSAGVAELSRRLDLPKSTIFVHLNTLNNHDLVINENGTYRLSYRIVKIGQQLLWDDPLYEEGHKETRELANQSGLLANLLCEEGGKGVYLCSISGSESVNLQAVPGNRVPLHATGLGQAILAHLPEERVDEFIDRHGLASETPKTTTDREELFEELAAVRDRGVAIDDEEFLTGVRCIAAPIFADSAVVGAISVSGPVSQVRRRQEELEELVLERANVIELNVTYR
jgi:DNA-binding IclR family transcriptional regulator